MNIVVDIMSYGSVQSAMDRLQRYASDLESKKLEICEKLASLGALRASLDFARAIYSGTNDVGITVDNNSNGSRITASGESVLFIEYGSGAKMGYGHPEPNGYGAGTYPGKGHWNDPKGWWYGKHEHTFGNPPAMGMYNAKMDIQQSIEQVAEEVLSR